MKFKKIARLMYRLITLLLRYIPKKIGIIRLEKSFKKWYSNIKETYIFICFDGIGDIVWFMAYWKQYKKKHNIKDDYVIMANNRLQELLYFYGEKNITNNYAEFSKYIFYLWQKQKLQKYPKIKVMAFPKDRGKKVKLIEDNYKSDMGIMMDDCYRFGCFDLSYEIDEPITLPPKRGTDYNINTDKNILLIPYTNSRLNISTEIWEKITDVLLKNGFTVYTNVGTPKEKAIKGTYPLNLKLIELPAVLLKFNFVSVCGRCGLADWLFVNECKQVIIHSCKKNPKNQIEFLRSQLERKDSFKMMKRKCKLNENNVEDIWLYTDDMNDSYIQNVLEKIMLLG